MKTYTPTLLFLLASTIALAQEPSQKSITISIGGGRSFSSATLKQQALTGDGVQAGADVFVPFLRKGWDGSVKGSSKFTLGILAGAYYQSAKNLSPDISGLQSKYKLPTGNLEIMNTQNGSSNSQACAFSAGLQADLTFTRITISPSISAGYFISTKEGFTQNTQVMVNGSTRNVVLSASPKVKNQGLIIIPQLRVGYRIAGNLSVYAAGSMNAGPSSTSTQHDLIPAGGFNDKNTYEATQLASGKLALDGGSKKAAYITTNIQAGFSWSFGKSKAARRVGKTKLAGGGGGAAAASYAATGRVAAPTDTPRAGKQTQGATFGEKINQGLHAAGSAIAQGASLTYSPGNPIGGIIVKGGKNPGGSMMTVTTDNKGQFELTIKEAGNYRFVLTAPRDAALQGKSISEQGVKKSENPLYTGSGQTGNNPLHNAFVASPGNPIGGIIVKGGKNPGGSMITITTSKDGDLNLNGLTAGTYRFVITAP